MKVIFRGISLLLVFSSLVSCATIARGKLLNQKVLVKDGSTGKSLDGVQVFINGQIAGVTNERGLMQYPIDQVNKPHSYSLVLKKSGYADINLQISNRIDGGFIAGDVFLFFLGIIPGAVGFAVDGSSQQWYSFKQNINLKMQPIR